MSGRRQGGLFGDDDRSAPRRSSPAASAPIEPAAVRAEDAAAAAALPKDVRLGTSSWSFPGWKGIVWKDAPSERRLSREGLTAYSRHPLLRCVGLDRTHYAPMTEEQYRAHAAQVPEGFRFLVKAHEAATVLRWPDHPRYGARRGEENPLFLDAAHATAEVVAPAVVGLGPRLGVLLFQVAPQSLRACAGAAGFVDALHRFLSALPKGPRYAVEVRNRELLTSALAAALGDVDALPCLSVHPRLPPLDEQAHALDALDRPELLIRWMLHAGLDYDDAVERYSPFDRLVDEDAATRATVAELAATAARRSRPVTVVVNNKAEGSSPLSVFALAREIARRLASKAPDSIA